MGNEVKRINYENVAKSDLFIDAIYCSPRPRKGGYADDVLTVMLHNCRNTGGFRIPHRKDGTIPYIGLHLCDVEPSWPDYFDVETGIITYYGDNRKGGSEVEKTNIGGNKLLHKMFDDLANGGKALKDIPPVFVFQNTGEERDVRFIGLAVPGVKNMHEDAFFGTVWRTNKKQIRFPNYVAKFTVLDLGDEVIKREWLEALIAHPDISDSLSPKAWRSFLKKGLRGIKPLEAPADIHWPGKIAQMPDDDGMKILEAIHKRFGKNNPTGFEKLCKKILFMTDPNYSNISLTRPVIDGGRDAIMEYKISAPTNSVIVECAMEAKCYNPKGREPVGVKETSRLISRIKNRQFGVMMTTSYIGKQAYEEILEDGHPIMFFAGKDIVEVLRQKANVTSKTIDKWLDENGD